MNLETHFLKTAVSCWYWTHRMLWTSQSIVNTVNTIYEVAKEQYANYYKDLLNECIRSIHDPIKKKILYLSSDALSGLKNKGKHSEKISMLKMTPLFFLVCIL